MQASAHPTPRPGHAWPLAQVLRPAVGFSHPFDVLKDPWLEPTEKRAILASWASDACAVEDAPTLRRLVGADEPVALGDVLEALRRLDRQAPGLC